MDTGVAGPSQPPVSREEQPAPQAGPLPRKRGEIGYVEGAEGAELSRSSSRNTELPARHPADRGTEEGVNVDSTVQNPTQSTTSISETVSTVDSTSAFKQKGRQFLDLFKCNCNHKTPSKIAGVEVPTLFKFLTQFVVLCGTIVGWVFVAKFLSTKGSDGQTPGGSSSIIFMHVLFGIATLGQVLLIERRIFRIRAERYSYLHPGEVLPRFRNNRHTIPPDIIALSPWNRPPLPTYAAALAQSSRGTGDVEDSAIAEPPPPAYGNTRGSTFLLSGFLNENLRVQRPASIHSTASMRDRPKSYTSRDDEWEAIQDAERARQLEETLARLERGGPR